MDMSVSVYRVGKKHTGCNIKNIRKFVDFYIEDVVS